MEINSSNLYNKDILKTNKFENLNSSSLEKVEDKELREVSNNFEAFFLNQILETSLKSTSIAGEEAGSDIKKVCIYNQFLIVLVVISELVICFIIFYHKIIRKSKVKIWLIKL